MSPEVQVGSIWFNNRSGYLYRVVALPLWSDSPDQENLQQWVCMMNISTEQCYTRSLESFCGTNRDGQPRFTFQVQA